MKWEIEETDDEPDLTPMIDIVFLLIVFFMTVASVATAQKIEIDVPIADKAVVPENQESREYISLSEEGTLYVGSAEATLEDVKAIVSEGIASRPNYHVLLRVDAATPYSDTRELMSACAEVGAINITFTSYQGDK